MRILAVDPATRCGWAHSSGPSGVWDLRVRSDESNGMRLLRLQSKLEEVRTTSGVDLVVFEASRNLRYGHAVRVVTQLQGVIELWCQSHDIPYRGYSPAEIKRFAVGRGKADKKEMVAAARARWPEYEIIDDNQADALWVLELAKHEYSHCVVSP